MRYPKKNMDEKLKRYCDKGEEQIKKAYEAGDEKSFWWNPKGILSYNCLWNFIIGNRGGGKSFGVKEYVIKKALYNEGEFEILRRTETELKEALSSFMDDIVSENKFPGYTFRIRDRKIDAIECDEEGEPLEEANWFRIGYGSYLSGARIKKSVPRPKVKYIIFDEFLIPNAGINSYLPDEVTCFLEYYESVARMRDVIVFFLANALTVINPYFLYFDLHIPYGKSICRIKEDVAFEMVDNPAYRSKKKATRFGKLIAGTQYERYAIDNEFVWEQHDDIAKLNDTYEYWITLSYGGADYGIYRSYPEQKMIISHKYDKTFTNKLQITMKNGKINKLMMSQLKRYYELNALFDWFIKGFVYYDSLKTKGKMMEMFQHMF